MCDSKEKPNSKTKPKRKRSLRSFSLRAMMVVVTLLCFLLAWKANKAVRQKKAVAEIRKWENVTLYYDYQVKIDEDVSLDLIKDPPLPAPKWLIDLFGIDYFAEVVSVESYGSYLSNIPIPMFTQDLHELNLHVSKEIDLAPLANLESIVTLQLSQIVIRDMTPLAKLKNLRELRLNTSGVSDISPLANLKNLQTLDFSNTGLRSLSPLAGLKNIQGLSFSNTPVSDLSPLRDLKNIKHLDLSMTGVDDLTALQNMKNLQVICISDTEVSDLAPLDELKKLREIELGQARALHQLPPSGLREEFMFMLPYSNTSDEEVKRFQQKLPKCKVARVSIIRLNRSP